MSQVATDFQSQASSALPKGGRQTFSASKAPSGRFDDLLSAIPDAPPEPRARAKADAPERAQPAPADKRADRSDRTSRDDRAARTDRSAKSDSTAGDNRPAANAPPAKNAAATQTAAAPTDTKTAGAGDTGKTDDAGQTAETKTADTAPVTKDSVAALVQPTVVADPAVTAAVPSLAGDAVAKAGDEKPADAKAAIPTAAAHPSIKAAEQQAAAFADQSSGLTGDDAEVLSALAAKAQQGLKNAEGDKAEVKSDKPAHAAKLNGDAVPAADAGAQAKTDGGDAKSADARPVQSDLAKVGVEHQRSQGDGNAKTGPDTAQAAATGNTGTIKAPESFTAHLMTATGHAAGAASAAAAGTTHASSDDKPVAMANVAVEISARISSGKNQFDIRLDPEELGRIHVKVNVDRDGNITTHMMADRPDTLDLLRRDTQGLERALQDAGLKTSDNSLQFSLRDQAQHQQNGRDDQPARQPAADDQLDTTLTTTVIARDYGRYFQRPSGVDIRV